MARKESDRPAPPLPLVVLLLLLPVLLIFGATVASLRDVPFRSVAVFIGHPFTALAITLLLVLVLFGIRRGLTREQALKMAGESLAPMGALLCIMGGGGAFKQIIVDSGVGADPGEDADHLGDIAAGGGVPGGGGDAHRAGVGDGRDHHRGGDRRADGERHPRLQPGHAGAGAVLRRVGLLARQRLGVLAGEPVLGDDRAADAEDVDGDEDRGVGGRAGGGAGSPGTHVMDSAAGARNMRANPSSGICSARWPASGQPSIASLP